MYCVQNKKEIKAYSNIKKKWQQQVLIKIYSKQDLNIFYSAVIIF